MRLRIAHDWASSFTREDSVLPWCVIHLAIEGGAATLMQVWVPFSVAEHIASDATLKDLHPLTQPIMLLLLDRFSHLGIDGLAPLLQQVNNRPVYVVDVVEEDVALAKRLAGERSCKYQKAEDGDLFCTVAISPGGHGQPEVRPTTKYRCGTCPVPDKRLACSSYRHVAVFHRPGGGTVTDVVRALCDRDRSEIDRDRSACRPGGHECWEREVEFEQRPDEAQHALALHELLEFVDARWKSAFGRHLLSSRRGMAFGKLATPCATSADLEAKLSALAQVMKGFEVPDEMLKDEHRGLDDYKADRSLKRMESALEKALAEDPASVATVKRAIAVLREASSLRGAVQHGGSDVVARYASFGLPYPPPSAPETWARIQSRVAEALHQLADAISD